MIGSKWRHRTNGRLAEIVSPTGVAAPEDFVRWHYVNEDGTETTEGGFYAGERFRRLFEEVS